MSTLRTVLLFCVLAYTPAAFSGQDCEFPSRTGARENWVNAASGGVWEKHNPASRKTQKGYFRFIYYMQGRPHRENRLFLEAWQHMEVGHDRFAGCLEIKDREIFGDVELSSIAFRAADADSIYLDMKLYGPDNKSRLYSIRVPFTFIDTIAD